MLRSLFAALLIVVGWCAAAAAIDYEGKVTSFDDTARKLTVHVDDKDQTFELAKDCKIYRQKGTGKRAQFVEAPNGVKAIVPDAVVKLSTDIVDGNEVVTMVKIVSKPRKSN